MAARHHMGLTRTELVVALGVIGLLMAILLPSLLHSTSGGRRINCLNNEHSVGIALTTYEATWGRFPGYVDRIGDNSTAGPAVSTSWVVPLFPHFSRNDLWKRWSDSSVPAAQKPSVYLEWAVCPTDLTHATGLRSTSLSYVANCGRPGDADTAADGVFHNRNFDVPPVTMSLKYIEAHDGASTTLMLSENIQAGNWTDMTEANLGMVWHKSPGKCSGINQCMDMGDRPQDVRYARPSSPHPGGVNVAFCDGHARLLSEDIDYDVYQHLMTPDSSKAGLSGKLNEDDSSF